MLAVFELLYPIVLERLHLQDTQTVHTRIEETTVGSLRGHEVAAGNAFEAAYELPDGQIRVGPTIALYVLATDEKHRVGTGSKLKLGAIVWTVTEVALGQDTNGFVELQAQVSADRGPAKADDLDFFFSSRCDFCGGKTGWNGEVNFEAGRVVVGTSCIRCPRHEGLTGGRIEQHFTSTEPVFTPGRKG